VTDFAGVQSIRPGAGVVIKVFHDNEVRPYSVGMWDAQKILTGQIPETATASMMSAPAASVTQSGAPRCTAYGCDW